ncbi:MAG: phage tail tip lysozyme [Clostridia bacterium]|nr:phage tail tip lysozyme [Clostridia bacterium]
MSVYYIKNYYGKYLNIYGDNITSISYHQNVTLWSKSGTNEQKWVFSSPGNLTKIKSVINTEYALNYCEANGSEYGDPGNCDMYPHYANESNAHVDFIEEGGYYLIKLSHVNLYLTASGNYNGANVTWESLATTTNGRKYQQWLCENISDVNEENTVYASSTSNLTTAQREANATYIYNYLYNAGFTKNAICGILGNIQQESGFNPGIWEKTNNTSYGFGIVQWTPATKFINYACNHNIISSATASAVNNLTNSNPKVLMNAELDYLIDNCTEPGYFFAPAQNSAMDHSGYYMTFSQFKESTRDAYTLAIVFHDHYERSADTLEMIQTNRATPASTWYNFFS